MTRSPSLSDEDPGHKAYRAAIALPPNDEPAPASPQQERAAAESGAGSPLSVREHMARLVVDATKLGEVVRDAKVKADEAMALYRKHRDELEETTRVLRAYERIRTPKRRKP